MLPDNRNEIPTSDAAQNHPQLQGITTEIPALDPTAQILLLIGRDVIQAHKVLDQCNGPLNAPLAQKLVLVWVIVGNVCLYGAHKPARANFFKTNILDNGRPSHFLPCKNTIQVKESIGDTVFQLTSSDVTLGYSQEERDFLQIMDKEVYQDSATSWVAPLPFLSLRPRLPNNKQQAMQRLASVRHMLIKRPQMKSQFQEFMQTLFDNGHVEVAPPLGQDEESWYLPFFGVCHPRKLDQIWIVFDLSAQQNRVSLKNVLLTGPNLNNSLLGVLMRLWEEKVAVTADIK